MAVTINGTTGVETPSLTSTGTTVLATGKVRSWSDTDTDIDGLISGSTFGVLTEGGNSGHFTVGLRSNDVGDGFQVISKGAATTSETDPYNTLCFEVKANGNVTAGGSVHSSLNYSLPDTGTVFWGSGDGSTRIQGNSTTDIMSLYTVGVERLKIDASGRVTMPAQPAFLANHSLSTATTPSEMIWGNVAINAGSCYNVANGRFTAPVAGTYFFRAHTLTANATAGESRLALYKNGVSYGGAQSILVKPATTWATIMVHSHMYLSAGDYVSVFIVQVAGSLYNDGNYNSFSGHLVG